MTPESSESDLPEIHEVELQVASWCNRSCVFCPSGSIQRPKEFMSFDVVEKLVVELKKRDFSGTVGFHLICEPLLNKNLGDFVGLFRREFPRAYLRIESNGDALADFDRLKRLFDSGLNEVLLNCYDSPEQFEGRNRRLLALVKKYPEIWYRNKHLLNPAGPRFGWKMVRLRDFHDGSVATRSWAGRVKISRPTAEPQDFPLKMSCPRAANRLHVNYLGQIILCNNDWNFEVIAGDLVRQSLNEVWGARVLANYRERLANKDRSMPLCAQCDQGPAAPEIPEPQADGLAGLRSVMLSTSRRLGWWLSKTGKTAFAHTEK